MEAFIVRIYRDTPARARELAGTVERVGAGDRIGFSSQEQLLSRLLDPEWPGAGARPATTPATAIPKVRRKR